MKIILGGSDPRKAALVAGALTLANHVVERFETCSDALEFARLSACDAVIVCPETTDAAVMRGITALRAGGTQAAIIVITRVADWAEHDLLFGSGADDVFVARDNKQLLLARITAVIRRAWGHAGPDIRIGDLTVRLSSRTCWIGDRVIPLTRMEYLLVEALALRCGHLVSRQVLLELLYLNGGEPLPKSIDLFAHNIRRKFAAVGDAVYLASWGKGLILEDRAAGLAQTDISATVA